MILADCLVISNGDAFAPNYSVESDIKVNPTPGPAPFLGRGEYEKSGIGRVELVRSLIFHSLAFREERPRG